MTKWTITERASKPRKDRKRGQDAKAATIGRRQERRRKAWERDA